MYAYITTVTKTAYLIELHLAGYPPLTLGVPDNTRTRYPTRVTGTPWALWLLAGTRGRIRGYPFSNIPGIVHGYSEGHRDDCVYSTRQLEQRLKNSVASYGCPLLDIQCRGLLMLSQRQGTRRRSGRVVHISTSVCENGLKAGGVCIMHVLFCIASYYSSEVLLSHSKPRYAYILG